MCPVYAFRPELTVDTVLLWSEILEADVTFECVVEDVGDFEEGLGPIGNPCAVPDCLCDMYPAGPEPPCVLRVYPPCPEPAGAVPVNPPCPEPLCVPRVYPPCPEPTGAVAANPPCPEPCVFRVYPPCPDIVDP